MKGGINMDYQNLFNSQYINEEYFQRLQQQNFENYQRNEFSKMLKGLDDFIKASKNIAPQYQQQAFNACVSKICAELFGKQ